MEDMKKIGRITAGKEMPGSMTQGAYENLRADLLACRIVPGERLITRDLCDRFSVSLGAVREALSRLTSEGLIISEPQRGFRAAPISAGDLEDLTLARVELETLCLRRAIAYGDLAWETGLVAAAHHLSRTPARAPEDPARSNEAWTEAHAAFHSALVAGCGSRWLLHLQSALYMQSERYRRLSVPFETGKRDVQQEHRGILEAALARDADKAARLLTEHLEETTRILLRFVNESDELPNAAARELTL